ncbi:MAG: lipopolysaccharide biosynthesis protein [Pseudomonadota bacterium]
MIDDTSPPPQDKSEYKTLLRRFARNALVILRGRFVFGLLNLATAGILWRAIGPEAFGIIVLLQAYIRLVTSLVRLQTWAAIVRYGPGAVDRGDDAALGRLTGFTLRLDAFGFSAAILIVLLVTEAVTQWMNFPPEFALLAPFFILSAPFIVTATPTGILQLFGRVDVLAGQHALNAVLRFVGAGAVTLLGGGLIWVAVIWIAASVLSGLYMMAMAWREMRSRGLKPWLGGRWGTLTAGFEKIWRFSLVMNGNSLIETVVNHLTVLLVGGLLGPAAAGLFGVVRQITEATSKLGTALGPVIFPEMALLAARNDRAQMRRVLKRILLAFGGFMAVFVAALALVGELLLVTLFDASAGQGAELLVLVGAASSFVVIGFALEPAMLSIGKDRQLLTLSFFVTIAYVGVLLLGIELVGLIGVGLALFLRQAAIFSGRFLTIRRYLLKPQS